jgi:NAD(P)-dependent dehydrogenase (short-subunit alcohol dehydrogenase family)
MTASDNAYLRGKHGIVTGASRGIGAAIAEELARLGADVTLLGRKLSSLEKQRDLLKKEFGGKFFPFECDVSEPKSIEKSFMAAAKQLGPAYILVNNAGDAEAASFSNTSMELWQRMLSVNLTSTFLCTQQVLPAMLVAKAGRIINIASTAALKGYSHIAAYCAAKHGVVGLTRSLAAETAKLGITVNAVCPGYTDTEMTKHNIVKLADSTGKSEKEAREMLLRTIPRGTFIHPKEVASLVGWLCSPEASGVTGQAIAIAGGEQV